jgi:hypothetical protein
MPAGWIGPGSCSSACASWEQEDGLGDLERLLTGLLGEMRLPLLQARRRLLDEEGTREGRGAVGWRGGAGCVGEPAPCA